MPSESWLKDNHPCLVFVKVLIKESEEKADDDQDHEWLIAKMYRLKITQKNLNMNLNIHVVIHVEGCPQHCPRTIKMARLNT